MFKKLTFFISLIILINLTNFAIAEIIPLKKPTQTKIEKEQKLLIDVLKPLPKPVLKKSIKKTIASLFEGCYVEIKAYR